MSLLEALKRYSTIVADTGDLDLIRKFQPRDSTTNPAIILKTAQENSEFLREILHSFKNASLSERIDQVLVAIGVEILKNIPGRVSTEVDARYSFDTEKTVQHARRLIQLYRERGIDTERVLIKIAATWEGIQAAKILEKEGIHCNMTLIFSLEQAVMCAEVSSTLISPFVGRVLDWYKKNAPDTFVEDPGVQSVRRIFAYYKQFGYKTEVMAASFRNVEEILELSGCDLLTINPTLLEQLAETDGEIMNHMENNKEIFTEKIQLSEAEFRLQMNENAMATEKLAEGIRKFCQDTRTLETLITTL